MVDQGPKCVVERVKVSRGCGKVASFDCVTWIGWGLCLLHVVPHLVSSQEEQSVGVAGGVIIVEEVAKS